MKLYRKFIRPMHSYPGPNYDPRVEPIEAEVKWYPEEEREQLENKYASYNEGSFSDLTFETKFEPYALELLKEQKQIVRCKDCVWFDHYNVECEKGHDPTPPYTSFSCTDGKRKESR